MENLSCWWRQYPLSSDGRNDDQHTMRMDAGISGIPTAPAVAWFGLWCRWLCLPGFLPAFQAEFQAGPPAFLQNW